MEPPPEAAPEPPSARPSAFRDVPWRLTDAAVGLAPLVAFRVADGLVPEHVWAALPRWAAVTLMLAGVGWMAGFPVWAARRRGARVPRGPRPRPVLVEAGLALLLLPVLWVVLGLA